MTGRRLDAEGFAVDGWHGLVSRELEPVDLSRAVARLTDPASATETLHWGRNYLYATEVETAGGPLPVVVKQFRHEGGRKRLDRRLRGSKAERSWKNAEVLLAAGLDTPEPVLRIESDDPAGPSYFVTRRAEGVTEARYPLRAAAAGRLDREFPELPLGELLDALADLARRLHESGVWFRDFTSGNVLLSRDGDGVLRTRLVDLNRARVGRRPSLSERCRDLARMPILTAEHQERYLRRYWGGEPGPLRRRLYLLYHHAFLAKNRHKRKVRQVAGGLTGMLAGKVVPRGTHAHIPKAPSGAPSRERVVWDHLSDQPHLHASPLAKLATRLGDARSHLSETVAVVGAVPRVMRRYRELKRSLHAAPVPFGGAGVAVRPWPEDPDALLALVTDLGARPVLLRLHPWDPAGRDDEEALARELHSRGHELSFAVPQNRDLVRDGARWRAALDEIAQRFAPFGRSFQVGQAVNRSKWGVWTPDEYAGLLADARERLTAARPDAEVLGPAVIDFEYHATTALLNLDRPGLAFDAVSALLYVDRRGAPENRQAGFDTVDKVVLLKAIAETAKNAKSGRCWITEVNWPLREGPHAPAGRSVSVGEEEHADYLVRYYLLALGTGLVERVFWWQMIARGYGLTYARDGGGNGSGGGGGALVRRPAFAALATLVRQLEGTTFLGPVPPLQAGPEAAAVHLYRFRRADGSEVAVGWSAGERPAEAELPAPARAVVTRDGREAPAPAGARVTLDGSPVYFELE
jgi:hypothetical protein